jgi:hypothetical protein
VKKAVFILYALIAFLCGQTFAGATAMPVSPKDSFVKAAEEKALNNNLLTHKLVPTGKDTQLPVFPKKKRSKCLQQDFLICPFSEVQFTTQELPADVPFYLQNNCLSVQFLPNGKRGPPALA